MVVSSTYVCCTRKKAFDCIPRKNMWEALREAEVSTKLISVMNTHQHSCGGVVGPGRMCVAGTGVRQAGVLSPLIFTFYKNEFLAELRKRSEAEQNILHMHVMSHGSHIPKKEYNR